MAEVMTEDLLNSIQPKLQEITEVWAYVGYDEQECTEKTRKISLRVTQCLCDIIREENSERLELEKNVEVLRRELVELCQELRISTFYPERNLSVMQLSNTFKDKISELQELKQSRTHQIETLTNAACNYQRLLGKPSEELENKIKAIQVQDSEQSLSDNGLENLKKISDELRAQYDPFLDKFKQLSSDLSRLIKELEYTDELSERESFLTSQYENLCKSDSKDFHRLPTLNEDVLQELEIWRSRLVKEKIRIIGTMDELKPGLQRLWQRLNVPISEQEAVLVNCQTYSPKSLSKLQAEISRCQKLKESFKEEYIKNLRQEAGEMANKCFIDSQEIEYGGPDKIKYLEELVERLSENYTQNKTVFDSLNQYKVLWEELYEVETKMKDPAILTNRGGILLRTEKEKTRIQRELQKTETTLLKDMNEYQQANGDEPFRFADGATFKQFVSRKHTQYDAWKSTTKTSRKASSAHGQKNGHPGAP